MAVPGRGIAQDAAPRGAATWVEPGHWSMDALRRLDAIGVLPAGYDPAAWAVDRNGLLALLEAAASTPDTRPEHAALIRAYLRRLRQEFPAAGGPAGGFVWGRRAAEIGYRGSEGTARTAIGWPPDEDGWPAEPEVLPTVDDRLGSPVLGADLSGRLGERWAARLEVLVDDGELEVGSAHLVLDLGRPSLWAGRRALRLGPGQGNVIMGGGAYVDGAGLELDPFRLPWLLDHLGPVNFRMALVQLGAVAPYDHPLLWVMRGSIEPHPRLTLGVNRGTMVPDPDAITAEWLAQLPLVLIGKHTDGELNRQENTIASVDARYDVPVPDFPVTVYVEWGFEDTAGAWRAVPGVVAGALLPALPGAPWLSAAVEHASFAEMCCGNPWWYRHRGFTGGWTTGREPLGHPLGGHGTETAVRLHGSLLDARVLVDALGYARDRGIENLYAPTRRGRSTGGGASLTALLLSGVELRADIEHERADGWERTEASLVARLIF